MTPERLAEARALLEAAGPGDPCPLCSNGAMCHCPDWLAAEAEIARLEAKVAAIEALPSHSMSESDGPEWAEVVLLSDLRAAIATEVAPDRNIAAAILADLATEATP